MYSISYFGHGWIHKVRYHYAIVCYTTLELQYFRHDSIHKVIYYSILLLFVTLLHYFKAISNMVACTKLDNVLLLFVTLLDYFRGTLDVVGKLNSLLLVFVTLLHYFGHGWLYKV